MSVSLSIWLIVLLCLFVFLWLCAEMRLSLKWRVLINAGIVLSILLLFGTRYIGLVIESSYERDHYFDVIACSERLLREGKIEQVVYEFNRFIKDDSDGFPNRIGRLRQALMKINLEKELKKNIPLGEPDVGVQSDQGARDQ